MTHAPERVWVEQEFVISDESGQYIRYNAHSWNPTGWSETFVEYLRADLAAMPPELVERVRAAEASLINLQPKIANGLFRSEWIPVIDDYVDPAIAALRDILAWAEGRG